MQPDHPDLDVDAAARDLIVLAARTADGALTVEIGALHPDVVAALAVRLTLIAVEAIESYVRLDGADEHQVPAAVAEWLDDTGRYGPILP